MPDMTARAALPYIGFSKLRPGRIHVYCPGCGRKQSNAPRDNGENGYPADPPNAVLAHVYCEKCSSGSKDAPVAFLDADGRPCGEAEEDSDG